MTAQVSIELRACFETCKLHIFASTYVPGHPRFAVRFGNLLELVPLLVARGTWRDHGAPADVIHVRVPQLLLAVGQVLVQPLAADVLHAD